MSNTLSNLSAADDLLVRLAVTPLLLNVDEERDLTTVFCPSFRYDDSSLSLSVMACIRNDSSPPKKPMGNYELLRIVFNADWLIEQMIVIL